MGLIDEEFGDWLVQRGGTYMLPARVALRAVAVAQRRSLPVLGLDGFILWPDATQPFIEHSINLSVPGSDPRDSWRQASEFLVPYRDTSFFFEIVLDDRPGVRASSADSSTDT